MSDALTRLPHIRVPLSFEVEGRDVFVPAIDVRDLGDATFCRDYGLEFPYVAGAMATGIGSLDIVTAMARAGMLGVFGAAGLPVADVESAVHWCRDNLTGRPWAFNLIHSPSEPAIERAVADLYIRLGVRTVSASAYLRLTAPLVRYRFAGIHTDPSGRIVCPNRVMGKISRVEVAEQFLSPPPERLLAELVTSGQLTREEASLAANLPVAPDLIVEADSGGHTDNRPAIALLPTIAALRDRLQSRYQDDVRLRFGAAGGIATPHAVSAAFALGAGWVVGGSIHQACVESGTSDLVREMLAEASQADVTMAPAADMFEMGVKVQVLKRSTMFAQRATRLYELYRAHDSLESLPAPERDRLERTVFRSPLDEIWKQTEQFFADRDPQQLDLAARDPKHRMALVFRWYLGKSSMWARQGVADRKIDFQIWCGPAMGAFNEWVRGTFLEQVSQRRVAVVAKNLLYGAAVLARVQMLRSQGVEVPAALARVAPRPAADLDEYFDGEPLHLRENVA